MNGGGVLGCIAGGLVFGLTHPEKTLIRQGFPLDGVY